MKQRKSFQIINIIFNLGRKSRDFKNYCYSSTISIINDVIIKLLL